MSIEKIAGVGGLAPSVATGKSQGAQQAPGVEFGKYLEDMVGKVEELQTKADQSIEALATGQGKGLHEVMLAVQKANISFQMLTQVRNKAVEAYQEIMRMPV